MWRISLGLLIVVAPIGCGSGAATGVTFPDLSALEQLTLFSIDGRDPGEDGRRGQRVPAAVGEFRGYPVLGQVEVTDPERREQLVAALQDGYARRPKMGAKCFWPRHGIRLVAKGQTVEYVICFQCAWLDQYSGESRPRKEPINPDVQPVFDKTLKEAGVPIAPE
jgi:hypothetical protein